MLSFFVFKKFEKKFRKKFLALAIVGDNSAITAAHLVGGVVEDEGQSLLVVGAALWNVDSTTTAGALRNVVLWVPHIVSVIG